MKTLLAAVLSAGLLTLGAASQCPTLRSALPVRHCRRRRQSRRKASATTRQTRLYATHNDEHADTQTHR